MPSTDQYPGRDVMPDETPALATVGRLCRALEGASIAYCHWKSNNALEQSASGVNDLDLLVSRADAGRFAGILFDLGFKQAEAPAEKWMPAVLDYYAHDEATARMVHVHAHFALVLGHDLSKNYCLPIERSYLESARQGGLFRVPAPEIEYVVFIIRLVLKHATWDAVVLGQGRISATERQELLHLEAQSDLRVVRELVAALLPYVGTELFEQCRRTVHADAPLWTRLLVGRRLQTALDACARRPHWAAAYLKFWRRLKLGLERRLLHVRSGRRLHSGGAIIAIVGGDGAGKSTAVDHVYDWLARDFAARKVHLGKPPWSRTTTILRGMLSIGRKAGLYPHINSSILYEPAANSAGFPGQLPWMVRELLKARDRYLAYASARRFANNGGLVVCDRYPLPQIKLMDGPIIEQVLEVGRSGRLVSLLSALEKRYYTPIAPPDLLLVLKTAPEIAVRRKTDEDAAHVYVRSNEIWEADWSQTRARVIDSSRTLPEVLSEIKEAIWAAL